MFDLTEEASEDVAEATILQSMPAYSLPFLSTDGELEHVKRIALLRDENRMSSSLLFGLQDEFSLAGEPSFDLLRIFSDYDEKASRIVEDFLAIERERAEVREKYLEPFSEALSGRKVARFYQIENKIQAIFRYELARSIPVIEQ